ncbi:MAG: two-component sensor histidine kinase [Zetaproteobacteria bacterium]|nr:MAG: two-component sensor histidine kinase [Zetaproteobacteria bacterium]
MRLILFHFMVAAGVIMITGTQFYPVAAPIFRQIMLFAAGIFLLVFALQLVLLRKGWKEYELAIWIFGPDIVLVGMLVFVTGGVESPFSFLLGLLVIAAAGFAKPLASIGISLLAAVVYLAAVFLQELMTGVSLDSRQTVHVLLQLGALLLVGLVMSVIARRQEQLRLSEQQALDAHRRLSDLYARVLGAMQEGIVVLDDRLHVTDMNEAARLLTDKMAVKSDELIDRFDRGRELRHFLLSPEGQSFRQECDFNGRSVLVTATRLPGEDPDARWLLTLVDVTPVRELERRLAEQSKMAALGQMSAMLAHEIRNPIQALSQGLELLDRVADSKRKEIHGILQNEVKRLNRMVSGMLDFSRPLNPRPEWQCMNEFMQSVLQTLPEDCRSRVRLECNIDRMKVDGEHFRSVLENLLSNALKQGEETVDVSLTRHGKMWRLRVSDRGGGIPEKIRARIFDPFVSGRADGIGLGLATVRQLCKVNHWAVSIEDTAMGTCFEVSGPFEEVDERNG